MHGFLGRLIVQLYRTMYFHGARFSNYEAWLSDPIHIKPSAQVVWPVVGQEILNGDVGGGFQGIQITSGFFQLWRASGITSELQLYSTAIGGLVMAAAMFFAGWFHYHKAAPKLEWFQNVESMLNHHLAGLLGLGSLAWAGHQIHVSLPVNKLLDAGVDPKEIPLPHEFILNRQIMADLYPSFAKGLAPFFTLQWNEYSDFLTFNGGLNPVTGGLWLSDTAHHHVAIAVLFLIAGHMYRTNWGIGHSMKEILEAHKGPFTGEGHVGLYEILTTSWHAQLAINLALFGSLSIIVAWSSWVTLNPTICWNTPFSLFERLPQVLGFSFLSVFFNFVESSKDSSTNSWLNGFKSFFRKPTEKSSRKEQSAGNETLGFRILRDFTWDIRFFKKNLNTVSLFGFRKAKSQKRSPYDFSNFQKHSQKHVQLSSEKQAFLEWFLGFAEGDGSFGLYNGRLNFVINQAEIEILKKIRSELGFGNVSTFRQNERVYARYSVTGKHGIFCLIHLFNGNLHLQKVHTRFTHWVNRFNESTTYSEYEKILPLPRLSTTKLCCQNAWLSGFFDAEGGFSANITQPSEEPKRYFRLRLKAYIDQKDEWDVLKEISSLFQVQNVQTRNAKKKTYRVECISKKSLELVLNYFSTYPLRSKKHVVYAMWKKIASAYLKDSHLQNIPRLERRVLRIQNQNNIFKQLKTVFSK